MNEAYTTVRIWQKTRRLLRQIAAKTDESIVKVMDRLATAEHKRLESQEQRDEPCAK